MDENNNNHDEQKKRYEYIRKILERLLIALSERELEIGDETILFGREVSFELDPQGLIDIRGVEVDKIGPFNPDITAVLFDEEDDDVIITIRTSVGDRRYSLKGLVLGS